MLNTVGQHSPNCVTHIFASIWLDDDVHVSEHDVAFRLQVSLAQSLELRVGHGRCTIVLEEVVQFGDNDDVFDVPRHVEHVVEPFRDGIVIGHRFAHRGGLAQERVGQNTRIWSSCGLIVDMST